MSVTFKNTLLKNTLIKEATIEDYAYGVYRHFDAQTYSSITFNGADISGIDDRKGSGDTLAQPTDVEQPTYNATGINGRPSIDFSAGGTLSLFKASCCSFANAPHTVIIVIKHNGAAGDLLGTGAITAGNMLIMILNSLIYPRGHDMRTGDLNGINSTNGVASNEVAVVSQRVNATNISIYKNTLETTQALAGVANPITHGLYIGRRGVAATQFNGHIGEVLIWDRALSDVEYNNVVTNYVNPRWGI